MQSVFNFALAILSKFGRVLAELRLAESIGLKSLVDLGIFGLKEWSSVTTGAGLGLQSLGDGVEIRFSETDCVGA